MRQRAVLFNEVIDWLQHEFSRGPAERVKRTGCGSGTRWKSGCRCPVGAGCTHWRRKRSWRRSHAAALGAWVPGLVKDAADLSETIYSSGLVQVMKKGSVCWETIDLAPEAGECVLDRLIGPRTRR